MINELTADQKARFPEFVQKWTQIGLCTDRTDFDRAERSVVAVYQACGLKRPRILLRLGSPLSAIQGGALAVLRLSNKQVQSRVWSHIESQVGSQVWSRVRAQVRAQVRSQLWTHIESQVGSRIWSQVWSHVRSQAWSHIESLIRTQVRKQVRSQVWSRVWSQVRTQIESQVGSPIRSRVWSQVGSLIRAQIGSAINNDWGGQLLASWYAHISFLRDVCGWHDPVLQQYELGEALMDCGWVWWHEDVCAISDRPIRLRRNARGQLHSHDGMAVEYPDGWGVWAWNGMRVNEQIILRPETLTKEQIVQEVNAQVRQVMVERLGIERVCQMFDAKVLDRKDTYELLNLDLGDGRRRPYLKMRNPSVGVWHVEGVHPDCKTVQQAINWRAGNEESDWQPEVLT